MQTIQFVDQNLKITLMVPEILDDTSFSQIDQLVCTVEGVASDSGPSSSNNTGSSVNDQD